MCASPAPSTRGRATITTSFKFTSARRVILRALLRNPGFTVIVDLSLAVGIGATTAIFSVIYAILLHPFPYADSDRIVNPMVINEEQPNTLRWFATTRSQFMSLKKANCIEIVLGFGPHQAGLTGNTMPEDVFTIYLTENASSFFGVRPLLGSDIQPSDGKSGAQPVALLNYHFWQRHFQGASSVIGRTLQVDCRNYKIVGVMLRNFAFNDTLGVGDVYLPHNLEPNALHIPWIRLKRGVSTAAANAELSAMVHQFAKETPFG